MNEHDRQALNEYDIVDVVTTVQERSMVYLWQVVSGQIADPEAMRMHVTMAQKPIGADKTCTRLLN
jgi:hypothetical protein